jgi:ribose transport system substrate-binding protein
MTRWKQLGTLAAGLLTLTACGGTGPAAPTSNIKTVVTRQPSSISTDWVKWDSKGCQFVAATSHPQSWTAVVRTPTKAMKLALGEQGESVGQQTQMNDNVKADAKAAGISLIVGNYNYPSTTDPITAAQTMVLQKPDVAISYQVLANLLEPVDSNFVKACIPFIQVTVPYKNYPTFGLSNQDDGKLMGSFLGDYATKHSWAPDTITILVSQNPAFGADVTDRMTQCNNAAKAKVPGATTSYVDVGTGLDTTQVATTNWLTAHPNAQHILACGFADVFAQGMANALKAANRASNAAVVGTGGSTDARNSIKSGGAFAGTVNQHYDQYGDYLVAEAEDIFEGKPVPVLVHQSLDIIDATNA